MISIVSLGVLLGVFTSLDLCLAPKKKGAFTRQLIVVITSSIPAIYQAIQGVVNQSEFAQTFFTFFYPSYLITLVLSFVLVIILIYKPLARSVNLYKTKRVVSFFDFLFLGYNQFKNSIEEIKLENQQYRLSDSEEFFGIYRDLSDHIRQYLLDIYSYLGEDVDIDGYIYYVLERFIDIFFAETDARFTLRELDESGEFMVTKLTTRQDAIPGPIPLNKKNLINKSMEIGDALIYSQNQDYHYSTSNQSISKGVYEDYVSYCVMETDERKPKPYMSVSLDCKGDSAVRRMHTLVNSKFFNVICDTVAEKVRMDTI